MNTIQPNYVAWEWGFGQFPVRGTTENKIRFFLSAGILAPSIHNVQPWRFHIVGNSVEVTSSPSYSLPQSDPMLRCLLISLGCCIANITVAAKAAGFTVKQKFRIKKHLPVITLTFTETERKDLTSEQLSRSIPKRFSNKLAYMQKKIPKEVVATLQDIQLSKKIAFTLVTDRIRIQKIASIHKKTVLYLTTNDSLAKELAQWFRPNDTTSEDGMPGFVSNIPDSEVERITQTLKQGAKIFSVVAEHDRHKILSSSAIGILSSKNTPEAWFSTGYSYELIALTVTSLGLFQTPIHAIVEDASASAKIQSLLSLSQSPQMIFRLGYSKVVSYHTPRKSLKSVLI